MAEQQCAGVKWDIDNIGVLCKQIADDETVPLEFRLIQLGSIAERAMDEQLRITTDRLRREHPIGWKKHWWEDHTKDCQKYPAEKTGGDK